MQRWAPGATHGVTVAGGNGAGPAADQLRYPEGVAVDGDGNVYVADAYNNRVQRWAPGATSGVTVAGGNGRGSAANQLSVTSDLALDDRGNLYVADPDNNRVQRWAPGATSGVTVAGGNGVGDGADQLDDPQGMAVDPSGNVYVADSYNDRVQLWASPGPTLVPGQSAGPEGDIGTSVVSVPFTLSSRSTLPVTVAWTTIALADAPAGQADPTTDYHPASGTVVLAPGELAASVPITVQGDDEIEPNEFVIVSFHSPGNAVMGGFWGLGFAGIAADDVVLQPGVASVAEGASGTVALDVPVTLTEPAPATVTVRWETRLVPGAVVSQAEPGSDYAAASGTVTIEAVEGDTVPEPDELVVVRFHDPTGAALGGVLGLGAATIVDDD